MAWLMRVESSTERAPPHSIGVRGTPHLYVYVSLLAHSYQLWGNSLRSVAKTASWRRSQRDPDFVRPSSRRHRTAVPSHEEAMIRDGIRLCLPPRAIALCMYKISPDSTGRFVLDTHPSHAHVVVAARLFGHGFKFNLVILGKSSPT
ncbi:hypothetical protein H257_01760 [Aphanomyces astaci]|uniref:Uncharacterized protein n=1 Tax=Aphanomyces astaci TaxID=112090 RepID=W4H3Q9_APHAT|nr:hypothetical protein H257_01760 [Aphanomyces astaci]ETV86625.1 hypothetical protein H257_01760 [Aphanomyces astaci]|eukprot:XP_009823424.1 hypothetical protein H257_01760 [Aphanomyces astaci]